ncbi:hypothetical protein CWC24_08345, partial [Pseudoalteromonas ruthenica]
MSASNFAIKTLNGYEAAIQPDGSIKFTDSSGKLFGSIKKDGDGISYTGGFKSSFLGLSVSSNEDGSITQTYDFGPVLKTSIKTFSNGNWEQSTSISLPKALRAGLGLSVGLTTKGAAGQSPSSMSLDANFSSFYGAGAAGASLEFGLGPGGFDSTLNLSIKTPFGGFKEPFEIGMPEPLQNVHDLLVSRKAFIDGVTDGTVPAGMSHQEWLDSIKAAQLKTPDSLKPLLDNIQEAARPRRDPIVFDLDGDGVKTVGIEAGVLFDHNSDGTRLGTGWVSASDGLLVLDKNGNGIIDNGRELFGDNTVIDDSTGELAEHGYKALQALDKNNDGIINYRDEIYRRLQVWQDKNQDGFSQADELMSLADLGIVSIDVANYNNDGTIQNGNELAYKGVFTWLDGSEGNSNAVFFAEDPFYQEPLEPITVDDRFSHLPEADGTGGLHSLKESVGLNKSLADVVERFAEASTRSQQKNLIDDLLFEWHKTSSTDTLYSYQRSIYNFDNLSPDADGNYPPHYTPGVSVWWRMGNTLYTLGNLVEEADGSDHSKASVLEAFYGRRYNEIYRSTLITTRSSSVAGENEYSKSWSFNPFLKAQKERVANSINTAYEVLQENIYFTLAAQTRLKPLIDSIEPIFTADGLEYEFGNFESLLAEQAAIDPASAVMDAFDLVKNLEQNVVLQWSRSAGFLGKLYTLFMDQNTDESLLQSIYEKYSIGPGQSSYGKDAINIILSQSGVAKGGAGDDIILGSSGDDVITTGLGHNRVDGGDGNDTIKVR